MAHEKVETQFKSHIMGMLRVFPVIGRGIWLLGFLVGPITSRRAKRKELHRIAEFARNRLSSEFLLSKLTYESLLEMDKVFDKLKLSNLEKGSKMYVRLLLLEEVLNNKGTISEKFKEKIRNYIIPGLKALRSLTENYPPHVIKIERKVLSKDFFDFAIRLSNYLVEADIFMQKQDSAVILMPEIAYPISRLLLKKVDELELLYIGTDLNKEAFDYFLREEIEKSFLRGCAEAAYSGRITDGLLEEFHHLLLVKRAREGTPDLDYSREGFELIRTHIFRGRLREIVKEALDEDFRGIKDVVRRLIFDPDIFVSKRAIRIAKDAYKDDNEIMKAVKVAERTTPAGAQSLAANLFTGRLSWLNWVMRLLFIGATPFHEIGHIIGAWIHGQPINWKWKDLFTGNIEEIRGPPLLYGIALNFAVSTLILSFVPPTSPIFPKLLFCLILTNTLSGLIELAGALFGKGDLYLAFMSYSPLAVPAILPGGSALLYMAIAQHLQAPQRLWVASSGITGALSWKSPVVPAILIVSVVIVLILSILYKRIRVTVTIKKHFKDEITEHAEVLSLREEKLVEEDEFVGKDARLKKFIDSYSVGSERVEDGSMYVPTPYHTLLAVFDELRRQYGDLRGKRLLDLGAGLDLRVSLVAGYLYGMQVTAVEKDREIHARAKRVYDDARDKGFADNVEFINEPESAFDMDWSKFDFVFFFYTQPPSYRGSQFHITLEDKAKEMKSDGVLAILFTEGQILVNLYKFSGLTPSLAKPIRLSTDLGGPYLGFYQKPSVTSVLGVGNEQGEVLPGPTRVEGREDSPAGMIGWLWQPFIKRGWISLETAARRSFTLEEGIFSGVLLNFLPWFLAVCGFLDPTHIGWFYLFSNFLYGLSHTRLYRWHQGKIIDVGPARWYHRIGFMFLGALFFRIGYLIPGIGGMLSLFLTMGSHALYNNLIAPYFGLTLGMGVTHKVEAGQTPRGFPSIIARLATIAFILFSGFFATIYHYFGSWVRISRTPSVLVMEDAKKMGDEAARRFIKVVKKHSDAVIILPTGATPLPMYNAIVEEFRKDSTIDFSQVKFFNLDEYIGLPDDHPLGSHFYMKKVFYERLNGIDPARAPKPENIYIPACVEKIRGEETDLKEEEEKAREDEGKLEQAIKSTGREKADLVVLGVGGAYPVYDKEGRFVGIKGGHIGFNEPGSEQTCATRVVQLTKKTRFNTKHLFDNLKFRGDLEKEYTDEVPTHAITLGIANILKSNEILLLASGEDKAPVIRDAYQKMPTPDFPVTFLKRHKSVHWILDKDAANSLPQVKTPWIKRIKWSWNLIRQAVFEWLSTNDKLTIENLTCRDLVKLGVPMKVIEQFGGLESIKQDAKSFLRTTLHLDNTDKLPKEGERVLIFSPHPDDDVITMAATIKTLVKRRCKVTIVYLTGGEDAVRNDDQKAWTIFDHYREAFLAEHHGHYPTWKEEEELWRRTKIEVRRHESRLAMKKLGLSGGNIIFLGLPYYHRHGFIDLEVTNKVITENDSNAVLSLLNKINPDHIFYSAEADPHGTHGFGAQIIRRALIDSKVSEKAMIWEYRGAWQEWPLYYQPENLVIVPFTQEVMNLKIEAIQAHMSQLKPMYPGPDPREFYERARDRNREIGRRLEQLGYLSPEQGKWHAEAFRKISYQEFLGTKFVVDGNREKDKEHKLKRANGNPSPNSQQQGKLGWGGPDKNPSKEAIKLDPRIKGISTIIVTSIVGVLSVVGAAIIISVPQSLILRYLNYQGQVKGQTGMWLGIVIGMIVLEKKWGQVQFSPNYNVGLGIVRQAVERLVERGRGFVAAIVPQEQARAGLRMSWLGPQEELSKREMARIRGLAEELRGRGVSRELLVKEAPYRGNPEISQLLGWTSLPEEMEGKVEGIEKFARRVRRSYESVVVMGEEAELYAKVGETIGGEKRGYPRLYVLETTHPEAVEKIESKINLEKTLFVVSSPGEAYEYFYGKLIEIYRSQGISSEEIESQVGKHFVGIVEANTPFAEEAKGREFLETFNVSEGIGAPYSIFSYEGLVILALAGVNIKGFVKSGIKGMEMSREENPEENLAIKLAAFQEGMREAGRNRIVLVLPEKLKGFGEWWQKLVSRLGIEGKEIIPIPEGELTNPGNYGENTAFIHINVGAGHRARPVFGRSPLRVTAELREAGYPVFEISLAGEEAIGELLYVAGFATLLSGYLKELSPAKAVGYQSEGIPFGVAASFSLREGISPAVAASFSLREGEPLSEYPFRPEVVEYKGTKVFVFDFASLFEIEPVREATPSGMSIELKVKPRSRAVFKVMERIVNVAEEVGNLDGVKFAFVSSGRDVSREVMEEMLRDYMSGYGLSAEVVARAIDNKFIIDERQLREEGGIVSISGTPKISTRAIFSIINERLLLSGRTDGNGTEIKIITDRESRWAKDGNREIMERILWVVLEPGTEGEIVSTAAGLVVAIEGKVSDWLKKFIRSRYPNKAEAEKLLSRIVRDGKIILPATPVDKEYLEGIKAEERIYKIQA
jgi:glucosamine-6-phosphate deaminase